MDDFGPNEFGEFDDWYNDGENCGEELQNQAATLDKAEKEERLFRDEDAIKEDTVCWGGELFVRFVNHDGKKFVKRASAHMVKQTSDDSFVALTARTNLHYKPPDGSPPLNAVEGYFFLQRTDERDFAAVFKFKDTGIRHFKQQLEWNFDADHNHSGLNISAIKFCEVKKQMEDDLPDLKQLANLDEDEIDEQEFTVSGYPDVTIANGGQEPIKHMMFSVSGNICFKPGHVYGFDLLTSKGQNGGGLTNSEGELVGIYSGVGKHPASAEKSLGFATALTPDVKTWINEIE